MKAEQLKWVQEAALLLNRVEQELSAELQKTQRVRTAIELGGITAAIKALETVVG